MAEHSRSIQTRSEPSLRVNRRSFLRAAGAGAAGAALATGAHAGAIPFRASRAFAQGAWDQEVDVVVVGSGAAALTAAVVAAEGGSNVVVLEKAPDIGGTTAKSGGWYWVPNNHLMAEEGIADPKPDALAYMARCAFPHIYNPDDPQFGLPDLEFSLIETFYDRGAVALQELEQMDALRHTLRRNAAGEPPYDYRENYPENKAPQGRAVVPRKDDGSLGNGAELILQLSAAAEQRNVPLLTGHRVTRLVLNDAGEVVGVEATVTGADGATTAETVAIRARKAVIFGSGGFTHNPELTLHYQRGPVFGGCAVATNEGDFVTLALQAGAKLGNMVNAFRAQIVFEQAMEHSSTPSDMFGIPGDASILVNRYGFRVVDEKRNYDDRTEVHYTWDAQRSEWPNLLLMMVYDQRVADYWGGSYPLPAEGVVAPYVIQGQTWAELAEAIDARLAEYADRTGGFRLDASFAANLEETVARFNEFARTGVDEDFGRGETNYDRYQATAPVLQGVTWPDADQPNPTMHTLAETGPYYAIITAPGTLDTNGGPVINADAQVLNTRNEPIPGLYGAGNCVSSPAGNAYWGGGGTLGPAIVFGYIAGLNANQEPVKEV